MSVAPASLDTVLLVDDDKVTNLMHCRLIKRSALIDTIDIATDGIAALEYLDARMSQNQPLPELILLDINMPRMNGFEFLEQYARKSASRAPEETMIIMLSTSVLRADQERADADSNVHRYIRKPISVDDIHMFVEQYQQSAGRQC